MNASPSPLPRGLAALLLAASCAAWSQAPAGSAPAAVQSSFETLIRATLDNDPTRFHAACHEEIRSAVTPEKLSGVSHTVKPVLGDGYQTQYLGSYRKTGMDVHLFRLDPRAGEDDVLVVLAMRGAKCAGFLLQ
ncbi:hypothetical protein OOT46_29725 [Aquabacterium sp. A7-Y]|uniref:hypothetical protein n=1 Tax=Aquabacterium sp. A7-Y TaxID=1349605 RepID=UPI00223E592C|nr:hypothetical protein [Aquabacterium sp. A7-Y]MCW7541981.1 hypothetical protein [Aquabacterium sp. A7-Y]